MGGAGQKHGAAMIKTLVSAAMLAISASSCLGETMRLNCLASDAKETTRLVYVINTNPLSAQEYSSIFKQYSAIDVQAGLNTFVLSKVVDDGEGNSLGTTTVLMMNRKFPLIFYTSILERAGYAAVFRGTCQRE